MALATSNLSLKAILQTLGVSSPKAIFYIGSTLKSTAQLGALVNKDGLNSSYCPGANADARLQNLLNDRKLSYFKGYNHVTNFLIIDPTSFNFSADGSMPSNPSIAITINGSTTWSASVNQGWIYLNNSSGAGNGSISFYVDVNGDPISRDGMITITGANGLSETVTIYQEPS